MVKFEQGKVIKTDFGAPIKIVKYLASGGQGDVYIVEYEGKQKALKWYSPQTLKVSDAFYDNLKRNADKGAPDKAFLWPIAVTERIDGSFGYIMDLRPEGYYELGKILASDKYGFTSYKAATEACIQLTNAFRLLHNNGYCYSDMNDGHFFINPQTGDVLICDNDEVVPAGVKVQIMQPPRYVAPEIVVSDWHGISDRQAERHSLAVLIFLILLGGHPLEGQQWLVPCMTHEIQKKIYGSNPVFIFDPSDDSNRPISNIHTNVMKRWNSAPQYLKDAFLSSFSQQALKDPNRRLNELNWLKILVRLRSDIVRCSCGKDVLIQNTATMKCDACGNLVIVDNIIKLPTYSITAAKGSRVYRCQLGACNADEALIPVLHVVARPDGVLGVRNMTMNVLKAIFPSGKEKQIAPGEVIPLKAGISIYAYNAEINLM